MVALATGCIGMHGPAVACASCLHWAGESGDMPLHVPTDELIEEEVSLQCQCNKGNVGGLIPVAMASEHVG